MEKYEEYFVVCFIKVKWVYNGSDKDCLIKIIKCFIDGEN